MADPKGLALLMGQDEPSSSDLPQDMDHNKTDSDVLDALQAFLDEQRAKLELGPLKKGPDDTGGGGSLPGV